MVVILLTDFYFASFMRFNHVQSLVTTDLWWLPSEPLPSEPLPTELLPSELLPTELLPSELLPTELLPDQMCLFNV